MGLGTKIKDALSGDKEHSSSRQPRAPGAYPESADVPRSNTADSWQQSNLNKPLSANEDTSNVREGDDGYYTHTRAHDQPEQQPGNDKFAPNRETQNISVHDRRQNEKEHPYWGDFGTTDHDGRDANTYESNAPNISDQDHGPLTSRNKTYNGAISETGPQSRSSNMGSQYQHADQAYHVNFGNDAPNSFSTANSGARHQNLNNSTELGGNEEGDNTGLYGNEAYKTSRVPAQVRSSRLDDQDFDPSRNIESQAGTVGMRDRNSGVYQQGAGFMGTERSSPLPGSDNGTGGDRNSAAVDHYGPGHSGAKVMHRCQHCGNDNDISKYFNKDVVYRLS